MSQPANEFPAAFPHDGPPAAVGLPLGYAAPPDTPRRHSRLAWLALAAGIVPFVIVGVLLGMYWAGLDAPRDPVRAIVVGLFCGSPLMSVGLAVAALIRRNRRRAVAVIALVLSSATITMLTLTLSLARWS